MPGDCLKEELQLALVSSSRYMVVKLSQIHEAARGIAIRSLGSRRLTPFPRLVVAPDVFSTRPGPGQQPTWVPWSI